MTERKSPEVGALELEDDVGITDGLKVVLRDSTGKKVLKKTQGPDLYRRSGQWNDKTQVVDRRNDRYLEVIRDPDGSIIRHVDVPLSEHRGHGADKSQPKAHP